MPVVVAEHVEPDKVCRLQVGGSGVKKRCGEDDMGGEARSGVAVDQLSLTTGWEEVAFSPTSEAVKTTDRLPASLRRPEPVSIFSANARSCKQ